MVRKRRQSMGTEEALRVRPKSEAARTGWSLVELAQLTRFAPRKITDLVRRRLLPAPKFRGTATRYQRPTLVRLMAIRLLRADGMWRLADIKARIDGLSDSELERWVLSQPLPARAREVLVATATSSASSGAATSHAASTPAASSEAAVSGTGADGTVASGTGASAGAARDGSTAARVGGGRAGDGVLAAGLVPSTAWQRVELLPGLELSLRADASPLTRSVADRVHGLVAGLVAQGLDQTAPKN